MKKIKIIMNWIMGKELEPKELNVIDRILLDLKAGAMTAVIVTILIWIIVYGGFLSETLKKD
jgi:hypothetical protein